MIRVTGKLIEGVIVDGHEHHDFTLKPLTVRDTIELQADEFASTSDEHMGICVIARQIEKLGDLPREKITRELVMDMADIDFELLVKKQKELSEKLRSFFPKEEHAQPAGAGHDEAGVQS